MRRQGTEKSFWALLSNIFRMPRPRNMAPYAFASGAIPVYHIFLVVGDDDEVGKGLLRVVSSVNKIAETGFMSSITILSFLLAGFAIFIGFLDRESKEVALLSEREDGMSDMEFTVYTFYSVFVVQFVYIVFSGLLYIMSIDGGLFYYLSKGASDWRKSFSPILVFGSYFLLVVSSSYAVLVIKSFLFNIYKIFYVFAELSVDDCEED